MHGIGDGIISAVNASGVVARIVGLGASGEEARASLLGLGLEIRPFDAALAVAAGLPRPVARGQALSLGDRACMALAIREQARVVTADRAWAALDLDVEVEPIR